MTPLVFGLGVVALAFGGVAYYQPFVGGDAFVMGTFNPRGHAWLYILFAAAALTLAAALTYLMDRWPRDADDGLDPPQLRRTHVVVSWSVGLVGALTAAVTVVLGMAIAGNTMTGDDPGLMLLIVPTVVLFLAASTLALDRRFGQRHLESARRPIRRTRVLSAGLVLATVLLMTLLVPVQLFVSDVDDPPCCGSGISREIIDCPDC